MPRPPGARAAGALPEERRKATVLFADLSGYTAVAERMDPEAVKSIIDRALRRLGQEVVRYGGTVDKYIGDNVMAVFGAPVAHEDDPERAVRAGLAMQAAMEEINKDIEAAAGRSFSLRVGINSGEVLAGQVGDGYTVIGDVVNVAARLQAAARPGSVTVGGITHRLTRGAIEYDELEPLDPEGQVRAGGGMGGRAAAGLGHRHPRGARTAAPLIGREDESSLLFSLFDRVGPRERAPPGHGDRPGRGRQVAPAARVRRRSSADARAAGRPSGSGTAPPTAPGSPTGRSARSSAASSRSSTPTTPSWPGRSSCTGSSRSSPTPRPTSRPSASPPRSPARSASSPRPSIAMATGVHDAEDPQQMRDRLFSAIRSLVEAASRRWPVVIAIEDIHWADEGMLDLIEYLARWVRGPALIVCMARDELLDRRPGWGGGRRNATTIALEPLTPGRDARARRRPAPQRQRQRSQRLADLVPQVAERSAGNPLFAEEMVNRIREEGSQDVQTLPETVHAVLAARLDSLSAPERRVLQHASVVGQTFWEGSLSGLEDEEGIDLATRCRARGEGPGGLERRAAGWRASTSTPSSTC